jgi:hypothetical protein
MGAVIKKIHLYSIRLTIVECKVTNDANKQEIFYIIITRFN